MRNALQAIGGVVLAVVAFGLVRIGLEKYHEREGLQRGSEVIDQIRADAVRKHPDENVTEAMRHEAVERSTQELGSQADAGKRLQSAAAQFYGFYFVNMRTRPEYCRQQGVDISSFTSAFAREHTAQLTRARAVLSLPMSEDAFYQQMHDLLWKLGSQDMHDLANTNSVSEKGACQLVAEHGPELAQKLNVQNANPALSKALMGEQ